MINQEFTLIGKVHALRNAQKEFNARMSKNNQSHNDEFEYDNSEEEYGRNVWMGDLTWY